MIRRFLDIIGFYGAFRVWPWQVPELWEKCRRKGGSES